MHRLFSRSLFVLVTVLALVSSETASATDKEPEAGSVPAPAPKPTRELEITIRGWRAEFDHGFGVWLVPGNRPARFGPDARAALPGTLDTNAGVFVAPLPPGAPDGDLIIGAAHRSGWWGWRLSMPVTLPATGTHRVTFALDQLPVVEVRGTVWPPDADLWLEDDDRPRFSILGRRAFPFPFVGDGGLATLEQDTGTGAFTIRILQTPRMTSLGVRVAAARRGYTGVDHTVGFGTHQQVRLWLAPDWLYAGIWFALSIGGMALGVYVPWLAPGGTRRTRLVAAVLAGGMLLVLLAAVVLTQVHGIQLILLVVWSGAWGIVSAFVRLIVAAIYRMQDRAPAAFAAPRAAGPEPHP